MPASPALARRSIAIAALLLAALAAGCRERNALAPFTDTRPPPGLQARFLPPPNWAWGLIQSGTAPPSRYGVSAPSTRPRGDVVVMASFGEPAEVWFETAADLNDRGWVVWVLEPTGQGGSGHYLLPRELVHAPSLTPDVQALEGMVRGVVGRRPVYLLASPTAAPAALRALIDGLRPDGVALVSPVLQAQAGHAAMMRRFGFGDRPADGAGRWSRQGPDDRALGLTHDALRGRLRLGWQTANPDLRSGAATWSWQAAFAELAQQSARPSLARIPTPVLVTVPAERAPAAAGLCRRLRHCQVRSFQGAGSALQLETDEVRGAWLDSIDGFFAENLGGFAPPPPPATLRREETAQP